MNNITYRQDIMGRPGRRIYDMRPQPRGGRMPFSGNVWVGGKKISMPTENTTRYFKITFGTNPTISWVDAMPEELMESNSEVFDIKETAGDLHLPANFG